MFTIVMFGLRPNSSKQHIRVCECLSAQFVFFSRADSDLLLTVINVQVSDSTLSIRQPRISHTIKRYLSLRECPQFKTIRTTASTSSSSAAKRHADYSMYSTFLTASPASVLFSRSALLNRKDLCFCRLQYVFNVSNRLVRIGSVYQI